MAFQSSAAEIILWRMIAGIGIGVELVTIDTYIVELMPKEVRGRACRERGCPVLRRAGRRLDIAGRLGLAPSLGFDGWPGSCRSARLARDFVWFIRQRIPESPRWLIAHGKLDEADA